MKHYLVFDLGGTFTKYAYMNENAEIIEKSKVQTPNYKECNKNEFYKILDNIVDSYKGRIDGVAISMPGMLDSKKGYCITAGYLTYLNETAIVEELSERWGLPVTVENDGKCAVLAEYFHGNLKGCDNAAVVVLGSAVAGGLIINGKIYKGNHFTAGEYSYICVDSKDYQQIGNYWGICNGAQGLGMTVTKYVGEEAMNYNGERIFQEARQGNQEVLKALKEFTDCLALQIYNLNVLLDLDKIAVGGGISQQPLLFEYLQQSLDEVMENSPMKKFSPYLPKPIITNCQFYNDANLIGALAHFRSLN